MIISPKHCINMYKSLCNAWICLCMRSIPGGTYFQMDPSTTLQSIYTIHRCIGTSCRIFFDQGVFTQSQIRLSIESEMAKCLAFLS